MRRTATFDQPVFAVAWHSGDDSTQNEQRTGPFGHIVYRERNRVERLVNRLKKYWRIATR